MRVVKLVFTSGTTHACSGGQPAAQSVERSETAAPSTGPGYLPAAGCFFAGGGQASALKAAGT